MKLLKAGFSRPWPGLLPYVLCATYFLVWGVLLLPLLGLQSDEVMFLKNLYIPKGGAMWFSFFHHYYPAMMMSYLGALKCWLYAPALLMGPLSVWEVRLPMILLAAFTILALGRLLLRISGAFAACVVMLFFATDNSLLLTAVNDWGPVVLQNCLLVLALLTFVVWYRCKRNSLLFLAGCLLGLNLWNKALFLWVLSGMALAMAIVNFGLLKKLLSWRRCAALLLGLMVGAYPLLRFNLKNKAATVQQNARFESASFLSKAEFLKRTLNGQSAPGALLDMTQLAPDRVDRRFAEASRRLAAYTPNISTFLLYGGALMIAGGLILGTAGERRWIVFFASADLIAWFEAAFTAGAGAAVHHTALFLVVWYAALAMACGVLFRLSHPAAKITVALAVAIFTVRAAAAQNLLYANLLNYEARPGWSTAEASLAPGLEQAGIRHAIVLDWGFSDVITVRSRNAIVIASLAGELEAGRFDRQLFLACQAPACVLVRHTPQAVIDAAADAAFAAALVRERLMPVDSIIYQSTHGNPVIVTFHLRPR